MIGDTPLIAEYIGLYARGLWVTVQLVTLSCAMGLLLAIPLSLMSVAKNIFYRWPARGYIFFLRGTPLLAQLFLIYYGLADSEIVKHSFLWPIFKDAYSCALIAFTINTSAYTAEILRGAIIATPIEEIEAAQAIGMSPLLVYRRLILPSAFRRSLPSYSNEVVFMLHGSAIANVITLVDITGAAKIVSTRTYSVVESYIIAAFLYLSLTFLLVWLFKKLERRWSAHLWYSGDTYKTGT